VSAALELSRPLRFEVPPQLEATEPPEARGLNRDEVRLMIAYRHDGRLVHARFHDLPRFLHPGDLLVINTSRTLPVSVPAITSEGLQLRLHLSSRAPDARWLVELRLPRGVASIPFPDGRAGQCLRLPAGGTARLVAPFRSAPLKRSAKPSTRLWLADVELPEGLLPYLRRHGEPIRYPHVRRPWPLSSYQTVYALEPGSAEMPSAGRAFTPELVTRLVAEGVAIAPIVLHTGVSSLEEGEPPYPELFRVPSTTTQWVNAIRAGGGRVVAVGTTVVRALESAAERHGEAVAREGWTDVVVTPEEGVSVVDGLLTGWHTSGGSHLSLLEAVGGRSLVEASYRAALAEGYLWHEFGDLHLILP
jgi:S-adenosylmethionine:tRNA ribosyltransferase-isomerase